MYRYQVPETGRRDLPYTPCVHTILYQIPLTAGRPYMDLNGLDLNHFYHECTSTHATSQSESE